MPGRLAPVGVQLRMQPLQLRPSCMGLWRRCLLACRAVGPLPPQDACIRCMRPNSSCCWRLALLVQVALCSRQHLSGRGSGGLGPWIWLLGPRLCMAARRGVLQQAGQSVSASCLLSGSGAPPSVRTLVAR